MRSVNELCKRINSESGYGLWATMFNKLEQYLFYLFLFSIPFQTRKILYFDEWRFNEWQSMSVYATDVLLAVLFGFWVYNFYKKLIYDLRFTIYGKNLKTLILNTKYLIRNPNFYLLAFLVISAISIKNSDNYLISWYQWFKLAEFVCFYWYLANYAFKKFGLFNSFLAIFISGIFQAVVAIIQFLRQSSLGLKYLGESVINNDFSGVASFYISDTEKIIRAYGTTPHPNVLAVFLLLSLFAFYFIFLNNKYSRNTRCLLLTAYAFILFGFFLTFSRVIILAWGIVFWGGIMIYHKKYRQEVKKVFLVTLAVASLFAIIFWPEILSRLTIGGDDQAIELRSFYAKEALKTNINFFGIGFGNFMSWLIKENPFLSAYAYQPVHNIYLLIYAETGLLGVSAFLLFLFFLIKNSIKKISQSSFALHSLLFALCLLFIGFFDHMFWTLQSGRLIFWFSMAGLTYYQKDDRM